MPTYVPRLRKTDLTESSLADLYFLHADDYDSHIEFRNTNQKIVGIEKLAGRFLKKLFTRKGTNPLDRNEGTEFTEIIGHSAAEEEDLMLALQTTLEAAVEQVRNDETLSDAYPVYSLQDDEQLSSATVAKYEKTAADHIDVWVNLVSKAGISATIKLPRT